VFGVLPVGDVINTRENKIFGEVRRFGKLVMPNV